MGVHAVMGGRWSSTRGKVLAGVRVGVAARWITPGLVDEVLAEAGETAAGQAGQGGRRFRALPARLSTPGRRPAMRCANLYLEDGLRETFQGKLSP